MTITVKTASGHVVRSLHRRLVPVNAPQSVVFTCNLPKGSYRWLVSARDTAGNLEVGRGDRPPQGALSRGFAGGRSRSAPASRAGACVRRTGRARP